MLTFAYPAWFLALCALAGLTVALLLYWGDRTFREAPRGVVWGMGVLRFLGYSLIAALLLSPLLRLVRTETEAPIVVMLQDVSESVGLETDTLAYTERWQALRDELAENYRVIDYTFGNELRRGGSLRFDAKETDLDGALTEVAELYGSQNLGAVVLATDGIYNRGGNPVYRDLPLGAPVYAVALGDTTRRRDLLVSRVFHNRIAYLGDDFAVQVDLAARGAAGEATTLVVERVGAEGGSRELHREAVRVEGDDFFTTREVTLTADAPGVQRYRIRVSPVGGEVSTVNNSRDIFVDVLDARQRILLLAAAPHPDIGALRQALVGGRNNEVEVAYADEFSGGVGEYDLVMLHQLPSATQRVVGVVGSKVPRLLLGGRVPAPLFNAAQGLLQRQGAGPRVQANEVTARLDPSFGGYTLSEELRTALPDFPPLSAPFGEIAAAPGAAVVLRQRIGRVDTDYPLLAVSEEEPRTGVLVATGLWQWRLYDYLEYGDHARFDEFVGQLVQYLTVREDRRRFRVSPAENIFDENEPVRLDAELYNASYEPINEPEVTIVVTGAADREYNYTFTRTERAYTLNAGTLPVGDYRYRARTSAGGEELTAEGRFAVRAVELERYALEADHNLLRSLSARYGGELIAPTRLGELSGRLADSGAGRPLLYESVTNQSILSLEWIFGVLMLLLGGEWILRRYFGGY